jgi:hypothetical protein
MSLFVLLLASALALGGCPSNNGGTGSDSGTPGTDSGTGADTGMPGTDSGMPGTDSGTPGTDSGTPDTDSGTPGTDSGTPGSDGGASTCMPVGRWHVESIACNGVPYTREALLTPPMGSWTLQWDGTNGTFTQTITLPPPAGTGAACSLVQSGTLTCDAPSAGEITHHRTMSSCMPSMCAPFTAACAGGGAADATWRYERIDATHYRFTSVDPTPIQTCTGAGQMNPIQVTWVFDGA